MSVYDWGVLKILRTQGGIWHLYSELHHWIIHIIFIWAIGHFWNVCMQFKFPVWSSTHSYVIWLIITTVELHQCSLNSICPFVKLLSVWLVFFFFWVFEFLVFKSNNINLFLIGLSITGHPMFQSLICVERYLAVVHPVTFLKFKPLRYRVICCTAVWIITLGSCIFFMFLLNIIKETWFFSTFLIFFSIQLFFIVAVLRALKQSGQGERERGKPSCLCSSKVTVCITNPYLLYFVFLINTFYI